MNIVVLFLAQFAPDFFMLSIDLFAVYLSGKYGLWLCQLILCVLGGKLISSVIGEIQELHNRGFFDKKGSDNVMRSSEMTHSEFEQWLEDTCSNAPNHIVEYTVCGGTRVSDWLHYRFEFKRGKWQYRAVVALPHTMLKHGGKLWLSKKLRNADVLKENFFAEFKKDLDFDRFATSDDGYFKSMEYQYCENRVLSDKQKKEISDDVKHFHQEVNEDLEYVSSEFNKLCDRLFGEDGEAQKCETDTCSAKTEKKCEVPVVKDVVQPIVKAAVKAKAVASYQNKMDRLVKQYKDYDTELRNLGTETGNYKKCMEAIQSEFNRQCEYVARIAEIERKQTDITDNPKAAEISKKVRDSYKAKRKEAESNIASLIDRTEQVIVLMQQDLENHIYDAKAQVETGKIDDMLSKLENSVQLDKEINGEAAKICLELKGIEPKTENNEG